MFAYSSSGIGGSGGHGGIAGGGGTGGAAGGGGGGEGGLGGGLGGEGGWGLGGGGGRAQLGQLLFAIRPIVAAPGNAVLATTCRPVWSHHTSPVQPLHVYSVYRIRTCVTVTCTR